MNTRLKNSTVFAQAAGIAVLFLTLGLTACKGISTQGTASSCEANTAQIIVYEGMMKRVCGCTEGAGTFSQPNSLTCTVSYNTAVYFYFVGINNPHQISVTNIGSTLQVEPNTSIKVGAITMNQVGSFSFRDTFNGIGGTFTVNP